MEGLGEDGAGARTAPLPRFAIAVVLEAAWLAFLVWMAVRGG